MGRHVGRSWPGWNNYVTKAAVVPPVPKSLITRVGERIIALDVTPVSNDSDHSGYIMVLRDISEEWRLQDERRELDRQLFQMEKMTTLGEPARGLTHEIGNPLAGMKTVVQALRSEELDPATAIRYLARIEGEVDRLSSFLHSIDGFAVPQKMHRQPLRLNDVLENVLPWTRTEARSQGIVIEFKRGPPSVPMLWADPHQLMQAMLNLVTNAIHAMPNGGRTGIGMCGPVHHDDWGMANILYTKAFSLGSSASSSLNDAADSAACMQCHAPAEQREAFEAERHKAEPSGADCGLRTPEIPAAAAT